MDHSVEYIRWLASVSLSCCVYLQRMIEKFQSLSILLYMYIDHETFAICQGSHSLCRTNKYVPIYMTVTGFSSSESILPRRKKKENGRKTNC